jgi:VanZ family protein
LAAVNRRNYKEVLVRILIFLAYGVFIALLSLRSVIVLPPGQWDKLGHFSAYGLFAVLGFFIVTTRKSYQQLCLGIILFSAVMEVLQHYIPGRVSSFYDLGANTLGVALGGIIATALLESKAHLLRK